MTGRDHLAAGLLATLPALLLLLAGLVAVVLDRRGRAGPAVSRGLVAMALVAALGAQLLGLLALQPSRSALLASHGDASLDRFGIVAGALVIVLGLVSAVAVPWPLARLRPHLGTYGAALLALTAGATVVCNSGALPGLYAGAELAGSATVVMVALDKRGAGAARAALRLLLTGGVGSALALYGLALIVGLSGHIQVTDLARTLPGGPLSAAAATLVVGGLVLKLAVGPLLLGGGDGPSRAALGTVAPALAIGVVTAYALSARLVAVLPSATRLPVEGALAAVAAGFLLLGSARALRARSVAALAAAFAWSGVGLLLAALAATRATSGGVSAGLLEAAALGGGVLVMGSLRTSSEGGGHTEWLRGLGERDPRGAVLASCGVVVLAGVPPLLGGLARAVVVEGTLLSGLGWLAAVIALTWLLSLVAAGRALVAIHGASAEPGRAGQERAREDRAAERRSPAGGRWALGFAVLLLATPVLLQQLTGLAGRAASAVLR